MSAVLQARDLAVRFTLEEGTWRRRGTLTAVEGVSFSLSRGETLGVVGESGCGKSTLGRALLGLVPISAGSVELEGERLDGQPAARQRRLRRRAQMVFQDPQGSLDPRMTVGQSVAEPLEIAGVGANRQERRALVAEALKQVGLAAEHADRYPHEFSGGQCQRIGIARALVLRPAVVVCDEPVSALDVSVQGQVVNLLVRLQAELQLACVFISHNLAVVRHLSTSVLVMYLGRPMEQGSRSLIYGSPLHPYTRALLDAVPSPEPGAPVRPPLQGELPSPVDPPRGCVFSTRCPMATDLCRRLRPVLEEARPGQAVACHRWREWPGGLTEASLAHPPPAR
jgi:oligopeptide transport system ATP-binding protein